MKIQLAALCLLMLAFGSFQMPARADFSLNLFGRHDRYHNGQIYRDPGMQVRLERRYPQRYYYDRLDPGYLNYEEVQRYRDWNY